MKTRVTMLIALVLSWTVSTLHTPAMAEPQRPAQSTPEIRESPRPSATGVAAAIAEEVRHRLVMMPYYGVFDWLEGGVQPNGTVTLRGEVTRSTTKSDAEARVRKVEGVTKVVSEIEVLPVSPTDDAIRLAMYRALFNYDSPLFRYATRAVPPIHIIVNNGRVTLKGYVASQMDKQIAYTYARGVSGVFEVKDELMVDKDNY